MVRQHGISIHALREEGDMMLRDHDKNREPISIHALCEEGDQRRLPRQPARGRISIHALCEEGDLVTAHNGRPLCTNFYPRPLRGGRPNGPGLCGKAL